MRLMISASGVRVLGRWGRRAYAVDYVYDGVLKEQLDGIYRNHESIESVFLIFESLQSLTLQHWAR